MASKDLQDLSENPFTDEGKIFWVYWNELFWLLLLQAVLERILEDEKSSTEEGWKLLKKNDDVEVWQKQEKDKPVHLIKVIKEQHPAPSVP